MATTGRARPTCSRPSTWWRRCARSAPRASPTCFASERPRRASVDELRARFRGAFDAISRSGIEVDIRYQTAPEASAASPDERTEVYARLLATARAADLTRGSSNVGPHRDDLLFELAGHE